MDDKDPQGPGDPSPGRSQDEGPPPLPRSRGRSEVIPLCRDQSPGFLSASLPIPGPGRASSGENGQSVSRDEGHQRSRGHDEVFQPHPASASESIPEGGNRGEKSKQSVSNDGAPPPLPRGRSEGFPPAPFPPAPVKRSALSVSLPIQERADSSGDKTKQTVKVLK